MKPHCVFCGLLGVVLVAQAPQVTTCTHAWLRGLKCLPAAGGAAVIPVRLGCTHPEPPWRGQQLLAEETSSLHVGCPNRHVLSRQAFPTVNPPSRRSARKRPHPADIQDLPGNTRWYQSSTQAQTGPGWTESTSNMEILKHGKLKM